MTGLGSLRLMGGLRDRACVCVCVCVRVCVCADDAW